MGRLILRLMGVLSVLAMVFLVSCGSRKPQAMPEPIVLTETKEVKEIVRDTIFKIEKDSAFYKAYIDCKDGVPILTSPPTPKGGAKGIIKPLQVDLDKNGNLTIKAETIAQELFKQWKEKYIKETKPKVVYVDKIEYRDKPFAWYHTALMWLGGITLVAIGLLLIAFFSRPKILR